MRLLRELASWKLVVTISLVLVFAAGCKTTTEDNDTTNTFVTIVEITSEAGDFGQLNEGTDLFSDVCGANEDNPPCTVFNDNAIVTFEAQPKDRTTLSSSVQDIVFDRYRVTYIRADGRNVPGVDVPYPFDGVSSFKVPVDGSDVSRGIIVVRHQAKRESPLREIAFNSAAILSVIAQIDFFGRDIAGRPLKVTGFLNITFADFANE